MIIAGIGIGTCFPAPFTASGAFSPTDIASLVEMKDPSDLTRLWKESTKTTQVSADGDTVGYAADFVDAANDVLQATAAARPLYKTASDLHWLLFDGSDDILAAAAHSLPTGTATCHIFMCIEGTTLPSSQYVSSYGANTTNNGRRAGFASNIATRNDCLSSFAAQAISTSFSGQVHLYEAVFTSTHVKTAVDGAAFTSTSYTSMNTGSGPFRLGAGTGGAIGPGMKLFFHSTFSAELSGDDRANMLTYSGAKGGLSL